MNAETAGRSARRGDALARFLATGAGLGYSPIASGTVGSAWGVALVWVLYLVPGGWPVHAVLAALLALAAIPICDRAEAIFGRKDDGRIVADEYLTFPICMIGLPFEPWVVAMAFLSARFFDIVKPPPARGLQRLHGGLGIVIDDVIACVYALALNHVVYRLAARLLATGGS